MNTRRGDRAAAHVDEAVLAATGPSEPRRLWSIALPASVIFGICIDQIRRRLSGWFVAWLNVDSALLPLKLLWWKCFRGGPETRPATFRQQAERYDRGLRNVLAAAYASGLRWRLDREAGWLDSLGTAPQETLRYLFDAPTMTAGDWWALVTVRAPSVVLLLGTALACGCSCAGKFLLLSGRRYQVKVVLFMLVDPTTPTNSKGCGPTAP